MMRYIKSGRAKMRIEESAAKKQGRIDSGRDVVVGANKSRIDKDTRYNGDRNGYGNEGGEDMADALRIDNAAVRENEGGEDAADYLRINNTSVMESHIRRLGVLRSNRDKNEVRDDLDHIERSAAISKYDNNEENVINNSNNKISGNVNVGGKRREEISTIRGDHH